MVDNPSKQIPPTSIESTKPIQSGEEKQSQPGDAFKSIMQEGEQTEGTAQKTSNVTPFDLAAEGHIQTAGPSLDTLLGQINSTSSVLGDVQNQLHTKNLKLKPSHKYLLRSKLNHANENIQLAAKKAGIEIKNNPLATSTRQSPVTKFLNLISDGQNQLNQTQNLLQNMKLKGGSLAPGDLLLIQVKLAKAQQEIEYSSVLLSKAVDDIKTMFNVQL